MNNRIGDPHYSDVNNTNFKSLVQRELDTINKYNEVINVFIDLVNTINYNGFNVILGMYDSMEGKITYKYIVLYASKHKLILSAKFDKYKTGFPIEIRYNINIDEEMITCLTLENLRNNLIWILRKDKFKELLKQSEKYHHV